MESQNEYTLFAEGAIWPPQELQHRQREYDFNRLMSAGKQKEAFRTYPEYVNAHGGSVDSVMADTQVVSNADAVQPFETINFHRTINVLFADLVAGGRVTFSSQTKNDDSVTACRRLWSANKCKLLFWEAAFCAGRDKHSIIGIRVDKRTPTSDNEEVIIERWAPERFVPEFDDSGDINAGNLCEIVTVTVETPSDGPKKRDMLRVIRHTRDKIQYRAFLLKGSHSNYNIVEEAFPDTELWQAVWPERSPKDAEEDTKIGELLFFIVPAEPSPDDWIGKGEFGHGIYNLMYHINRRFGSINSTISKFQNPVWSVPSSMTTRNEETGMLEFKLGDVLVRGLREGEADPKIITWEAELDESRQNLEQAIEFMFIQTDVVKAVFGLTETREAESGRSRKYALLPTLRRANRKIELWRETWADILYTAQLLEVSMGLKVPVIEGRKLPVMMRVKRALQKVWTAVQGRKFEYVAADYAPERPNVRIAMGLPVDEVEAVEVAAKKIEKGLATREQAYLDANPLQDPYDVRETLQQIESELDAAGVRQQAPQVSQRRRSADLNRLANAEPASTRQAPERPTAIEQ